MRRVQPTWHSRCPSPWLAVCLVLASGGGVAEEVRQRTGCAYERTTGELLYVEMHEERIEAGRVVAARVRYADSEGRRLAEKAVDFSGDPERPLFRFENTATGHLEGLESDSGTLVSFFRKSATSTERRSRLAPAGRPIADSGFDRFIESSWARLMRGERIVRPFLVPSRGRFVDIAIRRVESGSAREAVFVLEMDSALLRLVVAPIRVAYAVADRRLVRYIGLSNVRDARGRNFDARIVFEEPPACVRVGPGS